MPVIVCPTCALKLEVDDTAFGRQVECGGCKQVFTADTKKKGSKYRRDDDDEDDDRPRKRSKYRRDDDDDDDDDPPPRPTAPPGSPGLGITSLVLGILALVTFWCPIVGGVLAFLAILLGLIAIWSPGRGYGVAGMVLGAMSVLAMLGVWVWYLQQEQRFNQQNQQWNNPPPTRFR